MVSILALAVVTSSGVAVASADTAGVAGSLGQAEDVVAEEALAKRFAPVVRLVRQDVECGPGEPFQPSDVELVLGDPSVALRGPWVGDDLTRAGPTADDLSEGLFGYHLDLPGNPLEAGCDYEQWVRALASGSAPTTYAHVATEVGITDRLALQYWLFYPFNDYTNKHEGDWEMIQLVFAAADATDALDQNPVEVGYSQHEGLEVALWDDPKLQIVDASHPVVNAAAGSHANYFDSALYLGTSAEQGFGCDDTRGPSEDVSPTVAVIPNDPSAARADFPWIAFQGRWGQLEESFYNGPTGPNTKESWTHPISHQQEKGRDVSYAVPVGGIFGTSATDFFCSTVSGGSEVVRKLADNPGRLLLILSVFVVFVIWLLRRTTWMPAAPLRVARRRAAGQMIGAVGRMYAGRWRLFIGIGFLTVPASLVAAGLHTLILGGPEVAGVSTGGADGGLRVAAAAVVGYLVLGSGILLVLAATTHALGAVDRGTEVTVRSAYRLALARWKPLLGAFLIASALVGALATTVVLLPVAAALIVLFALYVPVLAFENTSALASLRRSAALVRHRLVKTAVLLAASILLAGTVGPLLGTLLILATGARLSLVNTIAGVTYAFLMPYVGLTMAYLYFDARVRAQLAQHDGTPDVLPAEAQLSEVHQPAAP